MQRKIPSQFVCGSHGACLECVLRLLLLPGAQVTAGPRFFSTFKSFKSMNSEDCDSPTLTGLAFSVGL